jgi:Domain of unknown function (DUF4376)
MNHLIEKDGRREYVGDLAAYPDWTVIASGAAARPIEDGEWDGTRWRVPMALIRARKWQQIKAKRLALEFAGCTTPHGTIDSDPESQRRVLAAAELARIEGPTFSVSWTMQDDFDVTLTAEQMLAVVSAMVHYQHQLQATSRALRTKIMAPAATRAQVAAVEWPA